MSHSARHAFPAPQPKRQRGETHAPWARAAAFVSGNVSIDMFTMDGSAFAERRSFVVGQARDGRKFTLRLRYKELVWLHAIMWMDWGTHTLTLFPGRTLTYRVSDKLTSITLDQDKIHARMFLDSSEVLDKLIGELLSVFGDEWDTVPVDELFQAFGILRRRNAVSAAAQDMLTRALGSAAYGKPVDSLVEYGERTGNPQASLVALSDRLLPLVLCLASDEGSV